MRLTPKRRDALTEAAQHPRGSISARTAKADQAAIEAMGFAASIDDCGHQLEDGKDAGEHRSHPHFLRITEAGRDAIS
ncbi:hypothetical protein ACFYWP_37185 [Actinacidiphila glaucinigra]|uniref:hypothetical protein n=1 Tax=Actinacidiphila glaucinigra TaxID=235986 RepID=UPI003674136D